VSEPTLADTGFGDHRDGVISAEHAGLLAATLDVDPVVLSDGVLPIPWHWTCFLPDTPTAGLGPDGHPARRVEMAEFPNRMWVGGHVEELVPLQLGVAARRRSELVAADRKDGSTRLDSCVQVRGDLAGPGRHVQDPTTRPRAGLTHDPPPPARFLERGDDQVHRVVHAGDPVEHRTDLGRGRRVAGASPLARWRAAAGRIHGVRVASRVVARKPSTSADAPPAYQV